MSDMIEVAKSGRAACRTCKSPIPKGDLRFGEEFANQFSVDGEMGHRWHHMKCAAEKLPNKLKDAMAAYEGEIPNRAELDALADEAAKQQKGKSDAFPYVDLAPTGRARCIQCREPLEKAQPRVAVERELDAGGMTRMGAGYLHPACAAAYVAARGQGTLDDLVAGLRKHTTALSGEALEGVLSAVSPAP
jgi:poly [ADP-ribose] polymerase